MQFEDLIQGSDEWLQARLGKITGTGYVKLNGTKATYQKYIYEKVAERLTNRNTDSSQFSNAHMDRGNTYEDTARQLYTDVTGLEVLSTGLIALDENVACSPDGLVGDDGLIEIKVPDIHVYMEKVLAIQEKGDAGICKEHYMQMQFNMFVCNREWCDYVLYQPYYSDELSIYVHRVYIQDKDDIANKLQDAVTKIIQSTVLFPIAIKDKVNYSNK